MHQPTDQHWREASLCAQTDAAVFFPEVGANATTARRICAVCPVRTDCLADALTTGDVGFGVRGGLTPTQRRALLNEQKRKVA
jgi:WhiB family transcriptional regulator, redox-sensing transcriptional regulator